ncbi:hypothetical protein LCGC14_1678390 [marine sediment metagenome]|uniref:Xaa-Pro dipeptidyl-peptidase-like domain-containing protein n=1 Tax=marine sediment metagenome TaxID=412755 RepID=A0A0F9KPB1_9ZZZZ
MNDLSNAENTAIQQTVPNEERRNMIKMTGASFVALGVSSLTSGQAFAHPLIQLTNEWDKTFPKSDKIDHKKLTFKNRYGIRLVADLYQPKNATGKLAAIVVGGPFGAVKEQSSGLYAQTMADRGFVTLAFDPSYTGESSGEPRNIASPDINTEDFSAAVDCLGMQAYVDRERIGIARAKCVLFV